MLVSSRVMASEQIQKAYRPIVVYGSRRQPVGVSAALMAERESVKDAAQYKSAERGIAVAIEETTNSSSRILQSHP